MPRPPFDWSRGNAEKIRDRHGVERYEVEEALQDRSGFGADVHNVEGEQRWGWAGATEDGRLLFIIFTRTEQGIRPISARDAPPNMQRRYRQRRGKR